MSEPLSPRSLLWVASFEMSAIGQEDIQMVCWDRFVEAAKADPGSILAKGLQEHTDACICQKIINLAKEIFNPSISGERDRLRVEAKKFLELIGLDFSKEHLPPGVDGLEGDFFQLLGNLYDLLDDHRESARSYWYAATCAETKGNRLFAAKLFAEQTIQVLSINPKDEKIQREAALWLEHAEEAFRDSQSGWEPVISCYRRVLELYSGDYIPSAKILEKMGKIYEAIPELQDLAKGSFVQAAAYHGFVNNVKERARNLEKAAVCAAKLEDELAAEVYKEAAEAYAAAEDHLSSERCFSAAAQQGHGLENICYERAAFHSCQLGKYVDAKGFYAKISGGDSLYDPNIYFRYTCLAADQLAEKEHKKSAACFKEAAVYYEKSEQFLDAVRCLEKLLEQRTKYKDHLKIKDFEILGKIAELYKRNGSYIEALDCCRRGFLQYRSPIDWGKIARESLDLLAHRPLSESNEERAQVVDSLIEVVEILKKKMSPELAAKAYELIEKWEERDLPEVAALFREAGKWFDFTLEHHFFALACYERAANRYLRLKQFREAAGVFRDIGFLYQESKEFLKAAEAYVSAAKQSLLSHPDLMGDLSTSDRALDLAKAAKLYHQAGDEQKAKDCYLDAARLNQGIFHYGEAGELFQAAADLGSDHLYEQAAECFILALKVEQALSCYKKCSQFDLQRLLASESFNRAISKMSANSDKANFHETIATFCSKVKLWGQAAWHWHEAGSCLKEEAPAEAARQFRSSADAHFECLDFSKAVKAYLLAAKLSEGILQADCYLGSARCYAKMDLRDEAIRYFSRATEIYEPIDASLALKSLKLAIACKPGDVILMGLYGHVLTLSDQDNDFTQQLKSCWLQWQRRPINDLPSLLWIARGFAKVKENGLAAKAYLCAKKLAEDIQKVSFYLEQAIDQYKQAGDHESWIEFSQELAFLYLELKQDVQAANVLTVIGDFYEKTKDYEKAAQFFMKAADIYKAKVPDQAAKYYQQAAGHFATTKFYNQAGECYLQSGRFYLLADLDLALESFTGAVEAYKQGGDKAGKNLCCIEAAREFSQRGMGKAAVFFYKEVDPSDQNIMILYLEQAAFGSRETDPKYAAACLGAVACKLAIKMDAATAEKYERAASLYRKSFFFEKAATDYHHAKDFYLKVNKNKEKGAKCCRAAAECFASLGENVGSMNAQASYQEAGELYRSISVPDAIQCFESAIREEKKPNTSILTCLEKIHRKSPQWKEFLTQAAGWFEKNSEFVKAMGVYGMLLDQHNETLSFGEKEGIRGKIEKCLKQCEPLSEGLVEAATWAAKAFVLKNFANLPIAAKFYRLAGTWEQDKKKAAEHLKKAILYYEMSALPPHYLQDLKKLAELHQALGEFSEAGFLFEKMGMLYKCNLKLYEDAATYFTEAARCHIGSGRVSQAVNCANFAAKCWKLLRRLDQVGNCLEQAGEWNSSDSPERAIADFLSASANFQQSKMEKRAEFCLHRAATLSASLGRSDRAVSLYEKIGPDSRVYDRKTHIGYLNQLASTLEGDQESLSRSHYYQQISDLHELDDQLELANECREKANLFKQNWLKHKTDELLQLLLRPQEYKSGYQQVQKWIEGMTSAGMMEEGLEFLKQTPFEDMTQSQLRRLKSNCHSETSKRWSKDQSYQATIETIFETVMKKTETMEPKSEQKLESSESSSGSSQEENEREALDSFLPAVDID